MYGADIAFLSGPLWWNLDLRCSDKSQKDYIRPLRSLNIKRNMKKHKLMTYKDSVEFEGHTIYPENFDG